MPTPFSIPSLAVSEEGADCLQRSTAEIISSSRKGSAAPQGVTVKGPSQARCWAPEAVIPLAGRDQPAQQFSSGAPILLPGASEGAGPIAPPTANAVGPASLPINDNERPGPWIDWCDCGKWPFARFAPIFLGLMVGGI